MKILLVEDEALIAMEQQLYLELAGHEVCGPAIDSHSAIAMASAYPHDLALVDVHLARKSSGIDAARHMTTELSLPCLFVTSHPEGVLEERIGLGCLIKPFTEQELVAAVEAVGALLQGKRAGSPLRNLILFDPKPPPQAGG
jgi:DNA-binding response OmpR family regulator